MAGGGRSRVTISANAGTPGPTVNVLVERFPFAKTFMAGPWRLLTTWKSLFPGKVHPPTPLPLLKAVVTTSVAWNWPRFALALLLGFYALLRPCEITALKANDCLLASETGCKDVAFLRLRLVKSRTRGAKMQNVRLDGPFVIAFLQKVLRVLTTDERIWCFSTSVFRRRLQQVLKAVVGSQDICVPRSLRPGGATYFFRLWQEDLLRLQWRGRWLHFKTLAHYIQELGCVNVLQEVSPLFRQKMFRLAELCEPACREAVPKADLVTQVTQVVELFQAGSNIHAVQEASHD